jgi:hypothetical protein
MLNRFPIGTLLVLIISLLCTPSSSANTDVRFSGFANIHATYSDNDELGFRSQIVNSSRDGVSLAPDSVLGLQANIKFNSDWDAVGQVIVQDRFDAHFSNLLELAFIRYSLNRNTQIKVGRFSTQSYLFTDFRYVGHAASWTRPPVEMYSQIGSLGNMDGINLNYRYSIGDSLAKVNLAYGQSDIRNDESAGKFRSQYKKLATINFEIQGDDWRVQSAYMSARLGGIIFPNSDLIRASLSQSPPILQPFYQSISDAFLPEDEPVSYFSIGGRYMFDNWELLAEYGDYSSDFALSRGTRSGYVSAGYYINDFVPYVIFAKNKNKNVDDIIDIEALQNVLPPQLVGLLIPEATLVNQTASNNHVDQESISVGLRWDINSAYAFKIEINHYRLGDSGSGLFSFASAGEPNPAQSFNVISAGFTTTF